MNVSLYCSPTHLKLIVGSGEKGSIRIDDYAAFPLPEGAMKNGVIINEEAMAHCLSEAGKRLEAFKHDALLVIDANSIRSKVMDIPIVPEAKILEFIAHEIGVFSDDDSGEVFDYTVLNGRLPEGGARVFAAAVDKKVIHTFRKTVTTAGFKLKAIDIGANALIKISRLLPQLSTGARILAVIDDRNMTLALFEDGEYEITNKYRLVHPDDTAKWREEIGQNISSLIQFHKGLRSDEEISAVFIAGISPSRAATLAEPLSFLGVETGMLYLAPYLRLTGKAAKKDEGFYPSQNLIGLGALLRKQGREA